MILIIYDIITSFYSNLHSFFYACYITSHSISTIKYQGIFRFLKFLAESVVYGLKLLIGYALVLGVPETQVYKHFSIPISAYHALLLKLHCFDNFI